MNTSILVGRLANSKKFWQCQNMLGFLNFGVQDYLKGFSGGFDPEMKMSEAQISAEIVPIPGEVHRAARTLQEAGFKVFHVGETISVQGPRVLFERTFNISFRLVERTSPLSPSTVESRYLRAETDQFQIPLQLADTVKDVHFEEPPEWF